MKKDEEFLSDMSLEIKMIRAHAQFVSGYTDYIRGGEPDVLQDALESLLDD